MRDFRSILPKIKKGHVYKFPEGNKGASYDYKIILIEAYLSSEKPDIDFNINGFGLITYGSTLTEDQLETVRIILSSNATAF